jgi:hypothetical protein
MGTSAANGFSSKVLRFAPQIKSNLNQANFADKEASEDSPFDSYTFGRDERT